MKTSQVLPGKRLISATGGLIAAFIVIAFAPSWFFLLTIALLSVVAFCELLIMYGIREQRWLFISSVTLFSAISLSLSFQIVRETAVTLVIAVLVILAFPLLHQGNPSPKTNHLSTVILGLVYVYLFQFYFGALWLLADGRQLIGLLVVGTWSRDLAAFLFGKTGHRGHPIWRAVSPRKTFEGAIFALTCVCVFVYLAVIWLQFDWGFFDVLAIGMMIGILGQVGDLVESWLKRQAGATDSSQIIPGQGGILDSFDSFIFTAPVMYFFLVLGIVSSNN